MNLKIGDSSDNGQITIIDEDRLCLLVRSTSRGACGIRTISKTILAEYIAYFSSNPDASPNDARDALCGQSEIDKFEYGYTSTLRTLAKMELGQSSINSAPVVSSSRHDRSSSFQQIFYGAPGTGKSHEVKRITGELEGGSKPNVFRTTFHPDTDYASFVGCYKPVMKPVPENLRAVAGREEDIAYDFVPQTFTDAYVYAYNHTEETTYLVIEEITRGNCAQIFGDLFQLLDRNENGTSDYSIKVDKDLAKYLSDALDSEDGIKDGKLSLPANLRILATMNTSDQSLFPIDSAFKRRWDWEYVAIDYAEPKSSAFTITIGNTSFRWVDFIKVVNQRIYDVTQSEDKQMGNFFIKSSVNQKQFCSKVMFYLWNEVLKDEVENSKYFFYEDKGNNQTSKFTFTDVYGGNATSVLINFMKYLGVPPLQNQPAQTEEPQTDTDAQ